SVGLAADDPSSKTGQPSPFLGGGQPTFKPAEPRPLDRADLDRRVAVVVYRAAVQGTRLWASKNTDGCFLYYQATLEAVVPMLDHRPKLQEMAVVRLKRGAGMRTDDGA